HRRVPGLRRRPPRRGAGDRHHVHEDPGGRAGEGDAAEVARRAQPGRHRGTGEAGRGGRPVRADAGPGQAAAARGATAALGAAGLAAFLALAEAVPRLGLVREDHFPPAGRIAAALGAEVTDGAFWTALGDTLTGWALGLAIAVGAGVVVGVVVSVVPYLREATASTVEFLRPIPSVADRKS